MNSKSCQLTPKVDARTKRQRERNSRSKSWEQKTESDAKKKVQNAITVKSLAPKMLANKPEAAADGAEEVAGAGEELEKSWIAGFKHGRYGYTTIWLFGFGSLAIWRFDALAISGHG